MFVKIGYYLINTDQVQHIQLDHTWRDKDVPRRMMSTIHFFGGKKSLTCYTDEVLAAFDWQIAP